MAEFKKWQSKEREGSSVMAFSKIIFTNLFYNPIDQDGNSQNFLRQILKIFITLGLNFLRFLILKVVFKAYIIKGWC